MKTLISIGYNVAQLQFKMSVNKISDIKILIRIRFSIVNSLVSYLIAN